MPEQHPDPSASPEPPSLSDVLPEPPIRLPPPPPPIPPRRRTDTVTVRRSTLNYVAIAAVFFITGYLVAWAVFTATTGSIVADVKTEFSSVVATNIAQIPRQAVAALPTTEPTATPIPRQVIDPGDAPAWGPANAKVTIVEFSDFECPFCGSFHRDMYQLLKDRYQDKVRFVYKDFPLQQHPNALPAALASHCADEQGKFWEYHDVLFASQFDLSEQALINYAGKVGVPDQAKFTDCLKTRKYVQTVQNSLNYGISKFVDATPTFFINGNILRGAPRDFGQLTQYLDYLLAQAG